MSDIQAKRFNEKVRSVTGMGFNLSAGVIAATAARVTGFGNLDIFAILWVIGAMALVYMSNKGLDLLISED